GAVAPVPVVDLPGTGEGGRLPAEKDCRQLWRIAIGGAVDVDDAKFGGYGRPAAHAEVQIAGDGIGMLGCAAFTGEEVEGPGGRGRGGRRGCGGLIDSGGWWLRGGIGRRGFGNGGKRL